MFLTVFSYCSVPMLMLKTFLSKDKTIFDLSSFLIGTTMQLQSLRSKVTISP